MEALLELPDEWAPPLEWVADRLQSIVDRWRQGEGNKRDALSLVRCLENDNDLGLPQALVRQTGEILDTWLSMELNEIDDDWFPYLDRLETDWGVELREKGELAKKFDTFVHSELRRWSPPPYMEELIDYAERFELSDLAQELQQLDEEERRRDEDRGRRVQPSLAERVQAVRAEISDQELDRLFLRLASTVTKFGSDSAGALPSASDSQT
jgi:hypothetical protein